MHFEHLVLSHLLGARNSDAWSSSLQAEITAVTGDDAAMSTLGVGADFKEFQKLFAPRVAELASDFIEPLDELSDAVGRVEQELQTLRSRQLEEMTQRWNGYKPGYERYLRPEALVDEDDSVGIEEQAEPPQARDNSETMETSTDETALSDVDVDSAESTPEEPTEPIRDSAAEPSEEASS
jgi:hypothetical protein